VNWKFKLELPYIFNTQSGNRWFMTRQLLVNIDFLHKEGAKPSVKTGIKKNNEYFYAT
jgi:hypothetical protein